MQVTRHNGAPSSQTAERPASPALKQFKRLSWKNSARNRFVFVAFPAFRAEMLLRHEAHLIVHLARAVDPVAEIDMGQAHGSGAGDVVEDHESTERAVLEVGIEVGID